MQGFSAGRGGGSVPIYRMIIVGGIVFAVFVVYLGYLFSMQILDGYIYTLRAEQVRRRSAPIAAPRGEIFDRNVTTPLATNRESFAVYINPAEIPDEQINRVFGAIADLLSIPAGQIYDTIPQRRYNTFQPVEVASGLTLDSVISIAERKHDLPGVSWRIKPARYYVDGDTFAHVLGYVGDITPQELQILYNRGYTQSSVVGKAGIELQYDEILKGSDGIQFRTVDAQGRRVIDEQQPDVPPIQGMNVVLTLDRRIQELAQRALGERIGTAVVLQPRTGEILGMVSYPGYDPNSFYGDSGGEYFTRVSLDQPGSFLNRAINAAAPPASTFKVLLTTALIEERAFPISEEVYCDGAYAVGTGLFKCHKEFGHGSLALFEGLAESCNVYFYTMGHEHLGEDTIIEYALDLGLGERSGIDLPGEIRGLVPTPEWKQRTRNDAWRPGDTVNLSIGQGFLQVTPLQLANMVAMIVNEGILYRPHVVKEIRDPVTDAVVSAIEPEVLRTSGISESTFKLVQDAMHGVIVDGTPQVVMTSPIPMGGKTGTSQTSTEDAKHSWFIGFAPYGNAADSEPIVTVVWIDADNEWDWWAPYATNIIIHGVQNGLNYEDTIRDLRTQRDPWLWYGPNFEEI